MNWNANAFDNVTRTRWSLVQRMQSPQGDGGELARLAMDYWYPVYVYVRHFGHGPEIAQDIVRGFFLHLDGCLRSGDCVPKGRFRDWLLARLDAFLAEDWRVPVEGGALVAGPPVEELERRNGLDHPAESSPEQAFQRGFALEVLARGFERLRGEARQTGHLDMYECLERFLSHEPPAEAVETMAKHLRVRPLALVIALKRLRQRFRELVREELADTVANADELAAEQRILFDVLEPRG